MDSYMSSCEWISICLGHKGLAEWEQLRLTSPVAPQMLPFSLFLEHTFEGENSLLGVMLTFK